jgi:TrmH family RNA methyltransferase
LIDSLNHPLAGPIRQLLHRDGRRELGQILIDDEENIIQALDAGVEIESVYFAGEEVISDTLRNKLTPGATIHEVAKRTTKKIFENDKMSRVFAIAETPKPKGLELLKTIKKDIVVLEDLSISGNIGNIIRTSLALDLGGMILLNMDPLDLYDRRLIRASRGYMFTLPIMTASTKEFLDYCKTANETLLVTAMEAEKSVEEIAFMPERVKKKAVPPRSNRPPRCKFESPLMRRLSR